MYLTTPSPEEFVLIPRNNFLEILDDAISTDKKLTEVLDLIKLAPYKDAKPIPTHSSKSKKEKLNELLAKKID